MATLKDSGVLGNLVVSNQINAKNIKKNGSDVISISDIGTGFDTSGVKINNLVTATEIEVATTDSPQNTDMPIIEFVSLTGQKADGTTVKSFKYANFGTDGITVFKFKRIGGGPLKPGDELELCDMRLVTWGGSRNPKRKMRRSKYIHKTITDETDYILVEASLEDINNAFAHNNKENLYYFRIGRDVKKDDGTLITRSFSNYIPKHITINAGYETNLDGSLLNIY